MKKIKKRIPYGQHKIDQDDINAVIKILKSDQITQGETVTSFGSALAKYTGAKYGIAVSNGTAALHLALASLDIKPGDEVITTPMTFCATANAVLYLGGKVVFSDIDEKTLNINITLLEKKITKRTKAIIPVDFRGHPANLPEIHELAMKYNLRVIEDGSHSIGSTYNHRNKLYHCGDGKHVDICTFSFHPVKHITTGEGGALLTNDKKIFDRISLQLKHGIDRREDMFIEEKRIGSWIYDMEYLGYNYRITDFQAALGISQLKKLNRFKKRRREIVNYYNENLIDLNEIILPYEAHNVDSNFHLYTLQVKKNRKFDRYDFFNYLIESNYSPMVLYIPVHLLKYYRENYNYKRGDFPVSEKFYDRSLAIPLYASMTDLEVEKVVFDIKKFVKK
jgi:perosamine synthetase